MALTVNLHDPVIWICEKTNKPYDADTYEATYAQGQDGPIWWKHTHLDGTICAYRKESE